MKNKYLVVFDLETTGTDKVKDHIIQFSALRVDNRTKMIKDFYSTYIKPSTGYVISIQAYVKHGITPKFLQDKPELKDVAKEIVDYFQDADVLTYNGNNFDIPFLKNSLNKIGYDIDFTDKDIYDSYLEERNRNGLTLGDTYKRYKGKTMEEAGLTAHDASSDIKATYAIFVAQNRKFPVKPIHIVSEDNFITLQEFKGELKECFNYGKYRQLSLDFVWTFDTNYFQWCISDKADFNKATKKYLINYINKHISNENS